MADQKVKSLNIRCKEYFGYLPDQNTSGFIAEMKSLTPDDKDWFVREFNKMGMPTQLGPVTK